jgi:HlyD family secretion protein
MNKRKNYLVACAIFAMILFIGYAIWIIARPVPIEIQGEVEATQIKVASNSQAG